MLESPICCGGSVSGAIVPSMSISGKEQAKTSDRTEPTIVAALCFMSYKIFGKLLASTKNKKHVSSSMETLFLPW